MKTCFRLLCGASLLLSAQLANAETTIEYGITAIGQSMDFEPDNVTTPGLGSVDFVIDAGNFHMYIEGASSIEGSAPTLVGGTNYDAGTAADELGEGRAQLSEISYEMNFTGYSVAVGLQNLFRFADGNSTSNDERSQFISNPLVNNPTIAMPNYTISTVLNYGYEDKTNMTFMLGNAYGLADNASKDYSDLVEFGELPNGMKKGVFALGELRLVDQDVWLSVGTWANTREESPLKGSYFNLDSASNENFAWSLRVGQNDEVAGVKTFGSFSTSIAFGDDALGLGLAVQKLAVLSATTDNVTTFETYYRWQLTDWLSLTPDVQYWQSANGLLDTDVTTGQIGGDIIVYGLRLQMGGSSTF